MFLCAYILSYKRSQLQFTFAHMCVCSCMQVWECVDAQRNESKLAAFCEWFKMRQ